MRGKVRTNSITKTIEIPDFSNLKAEQCLLASILLDNDSLYEVEDKLKPDFFYSKQHQDIYKKILELQGEGKAFDYIALLNSNIDNDYIEQLASMLTTSAFIHDYADSVIESFIKRDYVRHSTDIINSAETLTAQDLAVMAENKILEAGQEHELGKTVHVLDTMMNLEKRIAENMMKDDKDKVSLGILSNIIGIDRLTYGFKSGKVYILAARPSVGKTAMMMSIVNNIAVNQKIPTVIYSIEMDKEELMYRGLSINSQVPITPLELGRINDDQAQSVFTSIKNISESPLYINEESQMSAQKLRSNLRKMIAEHGVKIAFIDYLGLMDGDGSEKDMYHKVTKLSNDIRKVAKDLNIPIVLLCQLNRESEKRGTKSFEPNNSDLRDSGSLEQDAYCIIFIDRPELRDPDDDSLKGKAYVKITKNRGGKIGKSELAFKGEIVTFKDVD